MRRLQIPPSVRTRVTRWRRRVIARCLLRQLSSEQWILAIGNLESRDALTWARQEALAEAHRVLGSPAMIAAFEPVAAAAMTELVLERAYIHDTHPDLTGWIEAYVARRLQPFRWIALAVSAIIGLWVLVGL